MNTSTTKIASRGKVFYVTSQNTFILKMPRVANFADIKKVATTDIRATCKD